MPSQGKTYPGQKSSHQGGNCRPSFWVAEPTHLDKVEIYIRSAIDEGAKVILDGKRPTTPPMNKEYWVIPTDKTEASAIQDNYPDAPERVYYRLTKVGMQAGEDLWSNPLFTLYPEIGPSHMKEARLAVVSHLFMYLEILLYYFELTLYVGCCSISLES